jgi:hypothetical protein
VDIIDQILKYMVDNPRMDAAKAYADRQADQFREKPVNTTPEEADVEGRVPFFGLPMPERMGRPVDYAGPPPDLYDMIENPENYNPETGRSTDYNTKLLDLTREQGREGRLEKTPEQAMNTPAVSADKDIVEDALRATGASKNAFDLDKIIKEYGGEETPGGGIITTKKVNKPESMGLVDRGYVKDDTGRTQFIYSKKEDKTKGTSGDDTLKKTGNPIQDFYNSAAREVSKLYGMTDIRTFNPYEETRKEVNKVKDAFFRHIFGNKVASVSQLTPEQSKYWQAQLKSLETEKFNEIKTKYTLARQELDNVMKLYEKSKDKFGTAKAGDTIWDKNTGKIVSQVPDKDKRLPEQVAKDVEGTVANFFKPIASQGVEGIEIKNEDVRNRLDTNYQGLYDELREEAYSILQKEPRLSAYQAVSKAIKEKGWWNEADTKEKDGAMKTWRTPQGGGEKGSVAPPKTRQEAIKIIMQTYPNASPAKVEEAVAKRFPNLR